MFKHEKITAGDRTIHRFEIPVADRTLTLETGRAAAQADGAVLVRYGDTVVLVTAVASDEPREGINFFPLLVDYEEKMYSAGKIPGGFFRREGRPGENAILAARGIDRPLRPLFPKGFRNDVQIVVTVLSTDRENDPEILGIIGASAALMISDIPFAGPVAGVRMGMIDGELVVNPTMPQVIEECTLDLIVSGKDDGVMMVEGEAHEIPEAQILQAIQQAHEAMQPILEVQHEMARLLGKPNREFETVADLRSERLEEIRNWLGDRLQEALHHSDKLERQTATDALRDEVIEHFGAAETEEEEEELAREARTAFEDLLKEELRQGILKRGERPDGRSLDEIRPISVEVGLLPEPHGSALFTRGQTQALSVVALGSPGDEQMLDDLGLKEAKRYIHHYNFPPYSVGEARPMRGPRRRDIGHGALAERAMINVLPSEDIFPYTVRVVSEILESNGSSSMAAVCGSSLSLMDAGVPIRTAVAGIALGLITGDEQEYKLLVDIQGIEDALGDMDLKMAGTEKGVTALQMDLKVPGLAAEVLEQAFTLSRQSRLKILAEMNAVLPEARPELAPNAPRIVKLRIDPEKIGAVIGPGGKTIRSIIEASGADIDVEDDGSVFITTPDAEGAHTAIHMIEQLTRDPEVGDVFLGTVVRIMPYGAFVNILPNRDGMVHISELAEDRVGQVEDVVELGDEINVLVTNIDKEGKISLSRRALLAGEDPEDVTARKRASRSRSRGRGGRGRRRS